MRIVGLAALALVVAGCRTAAPSGDAAGSASAAVGSASAVVGSASAAVRPSSILDEIREKGTLTEAIAYAKPLMAYGPHGDLRNEGASAFLTWATQGSPIRLGAGSEWGPPANADADKGLVWSDLMNVAETSVLNVLKDPDLERGKRVCEAGTIIQITTDVFPVHVVGSKGPLRTNYVRFYKGKITTSISFYAVGSIGDLVERSTGRFCGIAMGKIDGTSPSVGVVGLFDLPENTKPRHPRSW